MIRTTSAALAVGMSLLALPSVGEASTSFGSRLTHDTANSGECKELLTPCTLASYIHPSDPNGDPYAGGAPVDGVITKFRIRAFAEGGPAPVTFRLVDISRPDPQNNETALASGTGTGPTVNIPPSMGGGDVPILEFPGSLPVKKGQHLAIDGTNVWATYNSSGDKFSYRFDPPLVDGQAPRTSNQATGELLVAAEIEPDVDRDGLGDETQDPAVRRPDTTKPRISGLKLEGSKLRYRLSEKARVTVRVKKGGRTVKTISRKGRAGRNQLAIGSGKLADGRYKLVVRAKDAAGNASAAKRVALRVR
jgi:hypothetical protein